MKKLIIITASFLFLFILALVGYLNIVRAYYKINNQTFTYWNRGDGTYIIPREYNGLFRPTRDYLRVSEDDSIVYIYCSTDGKIAIFVVSGSYRSRNQEKDKIKSQNIEVFRYSGNLDSLEHHNRYVESVEHYYGDDEFYSNKKKHDVTSVSSIILHTEIDSFCMPDGKNFKKIKIGSFESSMGNVIFVVFLLLSILFFGVIYLAGLAYQMSIVYVSDDKKCLAANVAMLLITQIAALLATWLFVFLIYKEQPSNAFFIYHPHPYSFIAALIPELILSPVMLLVFGYNPLIIFKKNKLKSLFHK